MEYIIHNLAFETTRRCNIKCAHCMRGPSQNIDMTKEIVDAVLNKDKIARIDHICFSGGEPTLNPDIIIYTIDKIIKEKINVNEIVMVTNGQVFNKDLLDAFNRFNEYVNERIKKEYPKWYPNFNDEDIKSLIEDHLNYHANIAFSIDKYHHPIPEGVKNSYLEGAKGIKITYKDVEDKDIYKTGFATIGKDFDYKLDSLKYYKEGEYYAIFGQLYITANGYITSEGMGEYADMDKINMGHISNTTYEEVLAKYGTPIFNTPKITIDSDTHKSR